MGKKSKFGLSRSGSVPIRNRPPGTVVTAKVDCILTSASTNPASQWILFSFSQAPRPTSYHH